MSKPETLHDCPQCGRHNFTTSGLRSHTCKGALVVSGRKPLTLATLDAMPLTVPGESPDAMMGRQLTEQWERVKDSRKQDLIFGAMMLKVRDHVRDSARGVAAKGNADRKGTGLKGWLATHAPTVSEGVAYRLMEIAEGVKDSFALGAKVDLEALLTAQIEGLDGKLAAKREKIEEMIEGRSQRQLLLEFGTAEKKSRGGARTAGTGKDYDPTAPIENARDLILHPLRDIVSRWREKEEKLPLWAHLPPEELREIDAMLMDLRNDLRAALKK